ncbi:hypothetical protein Ddc_10771 [Ditylenchus destructor]|nr:hypothetical protein Ddc_10771 [Ditylenchus destructor]
MDANAHIITKIVALERHFYGSAHFNKAIYNCNDCDPNEKFTTEKDWIVHQQIVHKKKSNLELSYVLDSDTIIIQKKVQEWLARAYYWLKMERAKPNSAFTSYGPSVQQNHLVPAECGYTNGNGARNPKMARMSSKPKIKPVRHSPFENNMIATTSKDLSSTEDDDVIYIQTVKASNPPKNVLNKSPKEEITETNCDTQEPPAFTHASNISQATPVLDSMLSGDLINGTTQNISGETSQLPTDMQNNTQTFAAIDSSVYQNVDVQKASKLEAISSNIVPSVPPLFSPSNSFSDAPEIPDVNMMSVMPSKITEFDIKQGASSSTVMSPFSTNLSAAIDDQIYGQIITTQDIQLSGNPTAGHNDQQSHNGLSITQPQDQRNSQLATQLIQPQQAIPSGIQPSDHQSQQFLTHAVTSNATVAHQDLQHASQNIQLSENPTTGHNDQQSHNGLTVTQPEDQRNCQLAVEQIQQQQATASGIQSSDQQSQQFLTHSATAFATFIATQRDLQSLSQSNVRLVRPKTETGETGQAHETWINWAVGEVKSRKGKKITAAETIYGYLTWPDKFKEKQSDRMKFYKKKWKELSSEEQEKYCAVAARLGKDIS